MAVTGTLHRQKQTLEQTGIGFDISEDQLAHLAVASATADEEQFVEAYQSVNWALEPARSYARGVRMALAAGAHRIARKLANEGTERFPDHRELQKMASILAEPTVRQSSSPADAGLAANRDWMKSHRNQYKGRWVALQAGHLLGVADTMTQLIAQIGEIRNRRILVTQVF